MGRRQAARDRIDALTGAKGGDADDRLAWFHTVYKEANGDPAAVPWADLAPKAALTEWLANAPGTGLTAIDIGCGLGDNAEALSAAGYRTTAFDVSSDAVSWAKKRFPGSAVAYHAADLFDLPATWTAAFDLAHECYTIQALDGDLREKAVGSIASLVAPGGRLLLINRSRGEGVYADGPPWPLQPSEWRQFEHLGLELEDETLYEIQRQDRIIPHVRAVFRKPA
nr:class I SAM-dependent methyltransferase [Roseibium denhamense]